MAERHRRMTASAGLQTLRWTIPATLLISQLASAECGTRAAAGRYGANQAYRVSDALVYATREVRVDADGAPDAYRVDGKGLSYTCDGVVAMIAGVRYTHRSHPATWQQKCNEEWAHARRTGDYRRLDVFGFEMRNGQPAVQNSGDPLPGEAFITTTSVTVPGQPEGSQRQYVNSIEIPFVVLPGDFVRRHAIRAGAVAAVYRPATGRLTFAVYGDGGGALNEASVRLHYDLGSDPMIVRNGTRRAKRNINDPVAVVVFPTVSPPRTLDAAAWRAAISEQGRQALAAWGGIERLKDCTELR